MRLEGRIVWLRLLWRALENRGEEAVGAVPGGCRDQERALGRRHPGATRLRPSLGQGIGGEVGVAVEEGLDLGLILLGQQRTCSVDQTPTGPYEISPDRQNFALLGTQFREVGWRGP